jgi:serine/threonine protein kinase
MSLPSVSSHCAALLDRDLERVSATSVCWERLELLDESPWLRSFRVRCVDGSAGGNGEFVLKAAREDLSRREQQIAKGLLLREAEVSRQVAHRNLVSTLAVERDEEGVRLIQPFVAAAPLRRFGGMQPLSVKLWLVRQVAEALMALQGRGWLHGCLSSAAVIVTANGHATVNELGWARRLNSQECDLGAMPFLGDVRYAAPESLDRQGLLGPAADVYALGGILGELVTGRRFWDGYEGPELVAAKRILAATEVQPASASLPFGIISLVRSMLNRDPLRRPSLSEVTQSLVAYEIETFAVQMLAKAA